MGKDFMLTGFLHQIRLALFLFWPVWIPMTVAAAVFVGCAVGWTANPTTQKPSVSFTRTSRKGSRGAFTAMILLALFLTGYIAMILAWENFSYHDNSIFTLYTLRGHDIGPPIMPWLGRFFPFGFQEFNLIRHFTDTITGYHALRIAQLLIFSCILLILDEELSFWSRAALVIIALTTPSILTSFTWLIYHEANVLLCIVCLALFVKRFEQTQSVGWAVAAAVCAQIMIYYKETASLLLFGFAVSRIVLRCRSSDNGSWDYSRLWHKESRLDLCLASLAVLFWLYYLGVMLPHPTMQYAEDVRRPLAELVLSYLKVDLLALLFVIAVLVRTYLIVLRKIAPSLLWDGLGFGGVACFVGYLGLGISAAAKHYSAPIDLIGLLYLGRLASLSAAKLHSWHKLVAFALLPAVLGQNVALSALRVFEYKNILHAKGEIAQLIRARYQTASGHIGRLFFPFASPYMIMEFASYLDYQGVPIKGLIDEADKLNGVSVATGTLTQDAPCVTYRKLVCHAAAAPDPGDLVIVLPDDNQSLAAIASYRAQGELLFSYEPSIPQWLYPLIRSIPIVSPGANPKKELPEGWLYASVTSWK
jgi:hypothetical protein